MRVGANATRINSVWYGGDFTGENRPMGRVTIQRARYLEFLTSTLLGDIKCRSLRKGSYIQESRSVSNVTNTLAGDVNFAFDSSALTAAGQDEIRNIVNRTEGPSPTITVVGHTDSVGSHEYNQALSERRAGSAKNYILSIKPGAIVHAYGRGETQPIATNDTAEGRAANRRVDISYSVTTITRNVIHGDAMDFEQEEPRELPTVASISINRSVDQDAATCTVTLHNAVASRVGFWIESEESAPPDQFLAGYYTFNRGMTPYSGAWSHEQTAWRNWIVPDRILRTYQGYGSDFSVTPDKDPNLLITGTWLIDTVTVTSDGSIVCECRDLAALLIDQACLPPVVPEDRRPMELKEVQDYTDIVKYFCATAGFFAAGEEAIATPDALFGQYGRIHGDMEPSYTKPIQDIPTEVWDSKPLMDCVSYVKEILGYIFFVDEHGGAIFRLPNVFSMGNYTTDLTTGDQALWDPQWATNSVRINRMLVIDERLQLRSYSVTLSNSHLRSEIMIGTGDGMHVATVKGSEPLTLADLPMKLRRLSIWTDQHFGDGAPDHAPGSDPNCTACHQCSVMADFIRMRQMFRYRVGHAQIMGNPCIQPDDQIRIVERETSEAYIHYVVGVQSEWDAATGDYVMTLETYWLGDRVTGGITDDYWSTGTTTEAWVIDYSNFSGATQDLLRQKNKLSDYPVLDV